MAEENNFMITEIDTGGYLGLKQQSKPIPQQLGQLSPIQKKKIDFPNFESKNTQMILPRIQTEKKFIGKSYRNNMSSSINNNSTSAINRSSVIGTFQATSKLDIIKRMMQESASQEKKNLKSKSKNSQNKSLTAIRSISVNNRSTERPGYMGLTTAPAERNNILTVLENYQKHIEEDYERLYPQKKKNQFDFDQDLRTIENKKSLFFEVNQKEDILFKEKKCLNSVLFEIKKKEQLIVEMRENLDKERQKGTNVDEQLRNLEKLQTDFTKLNEQLEDEVYKTETLQHMLDQRNKINLEIKSKTAANKDNMESQKHEWVLAKVQENIEGKLLQSLQIKHEHALEMKKKARDLPEKFQSNIKDELSQFGDKMALVAILKGKERKRYEEDQDRRRQREYLEQQVRDRVERETEKKIQEEKKFEQDYEKQKERFFPLTEKVQIQVERELIPYYDHLNQKKVHLQSFRESFQNEINQQKAIIEKASQYLEKLKFSTQNKDNNSNNNNNNNSNNNKNEVETLDPIEIEPELQKQLLLSEEVVYQKERKISKAQKLLDNVVVSLSRMLYQLQFQKNKDINFEVKRSSLETSISLIINNLENLLNLTQNHKANHPVTSLSINTNPLMKKPPQYMGINPNTYIVDSAKNSSVAESMNIQGSQVNINQFSNNNSIHRNDQSDEEENDYWLDTRKRIKTFL